MATLQQSFSVLRVLILLMTLSSHSSNALFTEVPKTLPSRIFSRSSTSLKSSSNDSNSSGKPILVVGATGKVGQKVVKQLLDMKVPVRALV